MESLPPCSRSEKEAVHVQTYSVEGLGFGFRVLACACIYLDVLELLLGAFTIRSWPGLHLSLDKA